MTAAAALDPGSGTARRHGDRSKNTVKPRLTANRGQRVVENDDYSAFARRVLSAYARRVAGGDIEALAKMTALAADLDTAIGQTVTGLRGVGYSWAEIGLRLGITRQAAQQRWGRVPGTGRTVPGHVEEIRCRRGASRRDGRNLERSPA